MRKRTKAIIAFAVSAVCVLASAGVAYGAIQSSEDREAQMTIDADAMPIDIEKGISETGPSALAEMKACEHDTDESVGADAGAIDQSAESEPATSAPSMVVEGIDYTPTPTPCTLSILGNTISYVDSFNTPSAPVSTAGLWAGSDSTTDGSWGYFIGHHPGVFNCVMNLQNGDVVRVCDANGNTRTYHVISVYDIPNYTAFEEIADDVVSHGESITLQTCYGDNQHYRIVEAV